MFLFFITYVVISFQKEIISDPKNTHFQASLFCVIPYVLCTYGSFSLRLTTLKSLFTTCSNSTGIVFLMHWWVQNSIVWSDHQTNLDWEYFFNLSGSPLSVLEIVMINMCSFSCLVAKFEQLCLFIFMFSCEIPTTMFAQRILHKTWSP